jgi:hypothetical protein
MEQIGQLKAMRDAARARIEATPDWRLVTSLDTLIGELEAVVAAAKTPQPVRETVAVEPPARNGDNDAPRAFAEDFTREPQSHVAAEDAALDRAVAELEAELVSADSGPARGPALHS